MARKTVTTEVVECDGCGRVIDPAEHVNFGNPSTPDATWKLNGMVNSNGLTLVCYAVKSENNNETVTDCCERCMRELVKLLKELV